jgi:hypothetical protein
VRTAFWIAGFVLLAAALLLTAHLTSTTLEFSRYNTGWNGTSLFFSGLDRHQVTDITDPAGLTPYKNTTILLIIAPEREPTGQETDAYRAFLQRGNTILLADDFGTGNAILRGIGSRISILPGNLSSLDRAYGDPYSVVVYNVTNVSPVQSLSAVVLNRAAPLEGGIPLLRTSFLSWTDTNGNERIDSDEALGIFSVMAYEKIGEGELIVLSDPSIFINSMQDVDEKYDNRKLIRNLVERKGSVLIDQMNSRTTGTEGLSTILHVMKTTLSTEILVIVVLLLIAAVAWKRKLV